MAIGQYQGVDGVARKIVKRYQGVDNVARHVIKAYTGVDGVARMYYMAGVPWRKWSVYREEETYYKEDGWVETDRISGSNFGDSNGYKNYSFDKTTGVFSLSESITVPNGGSGILYVAVSDTKIMRFVISLTSMIIHTQTSSGPYYNITYFKSDSSFGTVMVPEGDYPEETHGFTYVTTITEDGVEYVVMFDPESESYYCYNREE